MDPSRLDYTYDFRVYKEPYYSTEYVLTIEHTKTNTYYLLLGKHGRYTYFLVYFNLS